ncbi:hemicentin-2-like [Ptychodera flava]|uniref:hemicentin-2-like n=1 Tax=Ptychodera flava TaxID=63121 RepID=UPI003969C48B
MKYHLRNSKHNRGIGRHVRVYGVSRPFFSDTAQVFVIDTIPECSVDGTTNFTVITGDEVVFNCTILLDDNVPGELVWYNDGLEGSRIDGHVNTWTTTLYSDDNDAFFHCRLEHHTLPPWKWPELACEESIIISVHYGPIITIQDDSGHVAVEGEFYRANCIADANPEAFVHWEYQGDVIAIGNDLHLDDVHRNQNGNYTCFANNTLLDDSSQVFECSFYFDVQYRPEVDTIETLPCIVGESVTLLCEVADANPEEVDYTWYLADGDVFHSNIVVIDNVTVTLHGEHNCTANNTFYDGSAGIGGNATFLDVQYPPIVKDGQLIHKEGEPVTLSCVVDSNPAPSEYTWTKDGDTVSSESSFVIENVDRSHMGDYVCEATNIFYDGTNATEYGVVHLDVQYGPDITIVDETDHFTIEGMNYRASCDVDANPEASVYWEYPDDSIVVSSEVLLEEVTRIESGVYTCFANNTLWDGFEGSSNESFYLDVQYPPLVQSTDIVEKESESVTLTCETDSNPTPSEYSWTKNGDVIGTESTYVVDSLGRSDSGNYTCAATTVFFDGSRATGYGVTQLDVQYGPDITIVDDTEYTTVEFRTYRASCEVDANPEAFVHWEYPNGDTVIGRDLLLVNVLRSDAGNYSCFANNTFWDGSVGSSIDSFYLDVQFPPEVVLDDTVTRKVGEEVTLTCGVTDANPEEVDYTWYLVNGDIINDYIVDIPDVTLDLHGEQNCTAINTFYDQSRGIDSETLFLDVQYPPVVTSDDAVCKETESVTLQCHADANPMPSLYEWYRNDEVVSDESTHFIENVNRLDSGEYNCTATNEFYDNTNGSGHDVAYLDVQYSPSVKDGQIVCKEGDGITLTCEVDANPAPSSYTWTKDERELSSESSYNIPAVDRSDSGDYICTATNVLYDGTEESDSGSTQVDVQYSSLVTITTIPSDIAEGDDVIIECNAGEGNPDPYRSTLTYGESIIEEDTGTKLTHEITNIRTSDAGVYTCTFYTKFYDDNEDVRHDLDNIVVHYSASILPESTTEFTVGIGDTQSLGCTAEGLPTPDIIWLDVNDEEITGEDDNLVISGTTTRDTSSTSTLSVTVADDDYYGTYTCEASNWVEPKDQRGFEIRKPDDGVNAGLVAGTVSFLVIVIAVIIIIIAIYVYRRRTRWKENMEVSKNQANAEKAQSSAKSTDENFNKSAVE